MGLTGGGGSGGVAGGAGDVGLPSISPMQELKVYGKRHRQEWDPVPTPVPEG